MGREAETFAHWQGQSGEVRALLESGEVILRGGIRDRIARSAITGMAVDSGDLRLQTDRGPLVLELGAVEAARWLAALQKPAPSLAQKLGLGAGRLAFVLGRVEEAVLAEALAGASTPVLADAGLLVAVLDTPGDLAAAYGLAQSAPHLMIWCLYPKGRASAVTDASITDATVRGYFRERGYIDSKSCAVSESLTATRYGRSG